MSSVEKYALKGGGTQYKVRYRDQDGRQRQKKGFRTKRDATLYAATVETKKAAGTWVDPSAGKVTVGALHAHWVQGLSHLKKTTQATREVTWRTHVEPKWATREVGSVKPSQVRSWVTELEAAGAGVATVENALGVLRGVLALAVEDRLLPSNPAAGVKPPRRVPRQHRFLTHQQVAALAKECGRDGTVVLFLAYTGLRVGEAAALRLADVDFLRRRVSVTRSVSEVRGHGLVWSATKTYESRSVPFPAFLAEPLSRLAAGRGRDELLFGRGQEEPLRVGNWRRRVYTPAVKRCRENDATFPQLTVHDLRGTAASLAVSAGANVKAVQTLLGHASAAVTLDTYASLFPDDLEAVADALDRQRCASLAN
ncbi:tyrosine-type recombinase/integrase [Gordonia alkanivorans]|uniref:site-specific integrase n=1 Tax=Gordonia alkanivorans TaxID=84096 RepID=UPI00244C5749|nr:site-specific integrase [Gordonia alkanivorans]MDH3027031.1 tyrosine-type recombinase/integrase [Gordonia alkanivorans]MDH3050762.1 tyrosine-type recombinase/integrase [Gordonia alkanivorans]